ncbi:hypothetical protein [Methylacidiphilum sp. Yel]|uniref:hypothetical protein n=1 Tax=Methylacidiphilum sp. Yel TaxID=1847730 RepID=UPI00141B9CAA|nr:hypothetical protein [Methylacidiphilum sp. Yel]
MRRLSLQEKRKGLVLDNPSIHWLCHPHVEMSKSDRTVGYLSRPDRDFQYL